MLINSKISNDKLKIKLLKPLYYQFSRNTRKKAMSQQESQRVACSLIGNLDQRVWDALALKVIEKMPRKVNTQELSNNLSEFTFFNSNLESKSKAISEENNEFRQKSFQRQMMGSVNTLKRQNATKQIINSQPLSKIAQKRLRKMTTKILTEGAQPISSINSQNNSTILPLFISQIPNEPQIRKDDLFRLSKNQQQKFNQRQQYQSRERRIASEQRLMAERKKFKEVKRFTYDYQGKIINVSAEGTGQNIKIFNIKSFFKSNLSQQRQKQFKHKNIDPSKVSTVNTKKVVAMEHRRQDDDNQNRSWMKLGRTEPINLIQMFKGDQKIEMGVSITDLMQNSTICGVKRKKQGNQGLKLSDYKQKNPSSFKPRVHTEPLSKNKMSSQGKRKQMPAIFKPKLQLQRQSQAQSKGLSSSCSFFESNMGKINKNQRLYSQNFQS